MWKAFRKRLHVHSGSTSQYSSREGSSLWVAMAPWVDIGQSASQTPPASLIPAALDPNFETLLFETFKARRAGVCLCVAGSDKTTRRMKNAVVCGLLPFLLDSRRRNSNAEGLHMLPQRNSAYVIRQAVLTAGQRGSATLCPPMSKVLSVLIHRKFIDRAFRWQGGS